MTYDHFLVTEVGSPRVGATRERTIWEGRGTVAWNVFVTGMEVCVGHAPNPAGEGLTFEGGTELGGAGATALVRLQVGWWFSKSAISTK